MNILCRILVNVDTMLTYLCLDIVERFKEGKLNATEKFIDGNISFFVKVVCYFFSSLEVLLSGTN